jgi:radical SAM superfamily enzyme YgiQ (UPF0313 family)
MTHLLLVKPPSQHSVLPPLGLGYLASALKKQGVNARIVHCNKEGLDAQRLASLVRTSGAPIVGVSCCSNDHPWLATLAGELEAQPDVTLIVGGAHATGLGRRLFDLVPRIDYLVSGEGELALPMLCENLLDGGPNEEQAAGIPNLIWKDPQGFLRENGRELIMDLDQLDMPDWEQMRPVEYAEFTPHGGFTKAMPVAQTITTRGCPYGCSFCAAHLIHGRRIRRRSPANIVEEISYLYHHEGAREIHIEDDNFTVIPDHVVETCTRIRALGLGMPMSLPNGVRIDHLQDEILEELKATGFYTLSLGIESGSQATLKRMNKSLDLGVVEETIARLRRYDFQVKGYFIIGYPGETGEDILQTIQYARSLDLDRAYFTMFIPLPGTQSFEELEKAGRIDINNFEWEHFYTKGKTRPPFTPEGVSEEDMANFSHLAYRRFYMRPEILLKMVRDLRVNSPAHFFEMAWNAARLNLSYFL